MQRLGLGSLPINYEMKELCQLCGTRVRLSEIKHVSVGFTLLRCYTFMLKKFTFSLSKNTELPTILDVFLSLFLSGYVCSLYVWTKFPRDAGRRKAVTKRAGETKRTGSASNLTR